MGGGEITGQGPVVGHGDPRVFHDPLADSRDLLSFPDPGGNRIDPPVDEHPETGAGKPLLGSAGAIFRSGFHDFWVVGLVVILNFCPKDSLGKKKAFCG